MQGKVAIATWNSRALFGDDSGLRAKQGDLIRAKLAKATCTCIQESHGSDTSLRLVALNWLSAKQCMAQRV